MYYNYDYFSRYDLINEFVLLFMWTFVWILGKIQAETRKGIKQEDIQPGSVYFNFPSLIFFLNFLFID